MKDCSKNDLFTALCSDLMSVWHITDAQQTLKQMNKAQGNLEDHHLQNTIHSTEAQRG